MTARRNLDSRIRIRSCATVVLLVFLCSAILTRTGEGQSEQPISSANGIDSRIAADSAGVTPPSTAADAVIVQLADGRRPQPVAIVRVGEDPYLPLVRLARALGVAFSWDPYTFRGWIRTDSLETRFTLGSPVLDHDREGRQLARPIRYGDYGVLIPIDLLDLLQEQWNGGRSVRWNAQRDTLFWGSRLPAIDRLRLSQIGHQTSCRVRGAGPVEGRLLWSPLGRAELQLDGWGYAPESLTVGVMRGLISLDHFRQRPNGCSIALNFASSVQGLSSRFNEEEGSWEVIATTSGEEVRRGGFERLESVDSPLLLGDGPVILACCYDPAEQSTPQGRLLFRLAGEIAEILSNRLGQEAVILEASNPTGLAGRANQYDARCFVGLRLDRSSVRGPDAQVWAAAPRLRWLELDGTVSTAEVRRRPPAWSETPELMRGVNIRLAETIHSHLESQLGTENVLRGQRPSSWLEGLLMPSVLVYPANVADAHSFESLRQTDSRSNLARSLAVAISEAIAEGRLRNRDR